MKYFKHIIILILISLFLIGCRTSPILNINDAPFNNDTATLEDVTNGIIRAGNSLGWQMRKQEPGHIVGTLHLRTHMAEVDITYDTRIYNINYKNSSNLNYNADTNIIHSNYNGWIQNLNNAIQTQVYNSSL
jgi:hypothetical protein